MLRRKSDKDHLKNSSMTSSNSNSNLANLTKYFASIKWKLQLFYVAGFFFFFYFHFYVNIWTGTQKTLKAHMKLYTFEWSFFFFIFVFSSKKFDSLSCIWQRSVCVCVSGKERKWEKKKARLFIMKEAEHKRMTSIDFDIKKRGKENVK